MSGLIKKFFICVFLISLALPYLQQCFYFFNIAPIRENRIKIGKPEGNMIRQLYERREYANEYEKYFNDNYGMRDFYIRLRNQIDYSLFNRSNEVIIGKDGWLFDKSIAEKQQPALDHLSDGQWDRMFSRILALNEYLKRRGIILVLVPIPMKNTVYPEMFPDANVVRPAVTGFDKFQKFLEMHRELQYVDVQKVMVNTKKSYPVFYKTDLHWNILGAYCVTKELVDLLGRLSGTGVKFDYPFQVERGEDLIGGDSEAMALLKPLKEKTLIVKSTWRECGEKIEPVPKPYGVHYKSKRECEGPLLPKSLLVGNSFMMILPGVGFYDYFSEIYSLHDLLYFDELLHYIPKNTKFIIWQFFEVQLAVQFQEDSWWAQLEAKNKSEKTGTASIF